MFLVFVAVLLLGSKYVPGRQAVGRPDPDGVTRTYNLNGLALFLIVMLLAVLGDVFDVISLSVLHTHFAELFIVANVFACRALSRVVLAGVACPKRSTRIT